MGNDDIIDGFEKRLVRVEEDVRALRDADTKRSLDINTVTIELRNLTELLKEKKSDRYNGAGLAVASIAIFITLVSIWMTYPAIKHSNEIARAYETEILLLMSENKGNK